MTQEQQAQIETAENAIMEGLTNICGLIHMMEGWVDSMFPYVKILNAHDPKIMPQMIKARGECKVLLRTLSKELIRDDDQAIDLMFQTIGRHMSKACKMSAIERNEWMSKIKALDLE